jgi:phenylalanyl-tRNA synthetase beta chain
MKFSYQWIKDFVPGLGASAKELEQLITLRTAECDGIHSVGELLAGARVARVLTAEPVGETHITKTTVDIGETAPITVACGAPNCRAGMMTIWVPIGTKTIQGVESNGMLASAQELEISRDHGGIIEWAGECAAGSIDLTPDQIIEIDNKSLTHRPDLWGHLGMAREVAAITKRPLRDPVDLSLLPGGSDSYDIRIDDFELCPRFSVVVFENVQVRPSPPWLQYRLTSVGLNPIDNIVDITNYVSAELAQPMHAFDRDKLRGDRLIVRAARDGEKIAALNDEEYTLTPACGVGRRDRRP